MKSKALLAHGKHLRDLTSRPSAAASDDALLRTALRLARALDSEQQEAAAVLYLLRLLKERHREVVVSIERASAMHSRSVPATTEPDAQKTLRQLASEEAIAELQQRHLERMTSYLEDFLAEQRMQWTEELLQSTFAMPDGSLVLWGEATVEQHKVRRDMLLSNARGNMEAASRHERAIRDLTQGRRSRLRDLTMATPDE